MSTKAPKRLQTDTEADETESVEGSSNDRKLRKYDKWSLEEQSTFFLKLPAMAGAQLQDCVTCIAHHLPNKTREQVREYYYRLKAQFQKHNPSRDLNALTQKELIHAMTSMWAAWSNVKGQKPKLLPEKKSQANAAKMAKYSLIMQESLEGVFKARELKAELKAQRKADRLAGQQAQARAAREAERLRSKEAEQRAEQQHVKQAKCLKKSAGANKENCSLASNQQVKAKKQSNRQVAPGGKPARRTHMTEEMPVTAAQPAQTQRGSKGKKSSSKAAAAASEAQDPATQDSAAPELTELPQDDSEPLLPEAADLADAEPSDLARTTTTEVLQHELEPDCIHQQQESGSAILSSSCQQDCLLSAPTGSQAADALNACHKAQQMPQQPVQQQQQQQELGDMSRAMSSAASGPVSKEPLCLRLRPLDSATKRLMQGFGCTALVEMPNNKPKKAVEGLLRHLQKKWEQAMHRLGSSYQLHLVGSVSGQEDNCLTWTSASVSSALTLGHMQQQLQQSGKSLELCYVWMPIQAVPAGQSKASISAAAAAGFSAAKQGGIGAECQEDLVPLQRASASINAAHSLPFGSPLGTSSLRPSASSCSSARVLSEAFSNLHPEGPQKTAATVSAGQQSHAGKRALAGLPVDVTSSVSGLVTPCKHQDGLVHKPAPAQPDDTPGTSQLAASPSHSDLAWEKANLPDHSKPDIEPRLSQSHASRFQVPAQFSADLQPAASLADALPGQESPAIRLQRSENQQAELAQELSAQPSGALAEQPSGYLTREASVWSIQPPGALSAEPSGWWDELPDAAAEQALPLHTSSHETAHSQELPRTLHEPVSNCYGVSSEQNTDALACSSDLFELPDDMDFELPALDSPEQAACLHADDVANQQSACPAAQLADSHQADEADRLHSGAQDNLLDAQLVHQLEQEAGPSAADREHVSSEHQQDGCAKQGPLTALLASEEALLDDELDLECPNTQADQLDLDCPHTQADEQCIPELDQPAHGIPVIGTVVVGVVVDGKTPGRKLRLPRQAKPKQPNKAKRGRAAAAGAARAVQQQDEDNQNPGDAADPQDPAIAAAKQQKKARPQKKRKVESPPRLPPISPGALNLQEGIKRRRLAKEAEAKAAAAAASPAPAAAPEWPQSEVQPDTVCCSDWEQLSQSADNQDASYAPSHSQPADESNENAGHQQQQDQQQQGSDHLQQQSQTAEEQDADYAPSSSQLALGSNESSKHQQQQDQQQQQASQQIGGGDLDFNDPTESAGASPAGPADDSQQSCELGAQQAVTERQTELTLSFDVAAMELFQQQDTCDAFGSFWRRTSGAGVKGKGPVEAQANEDMPAALRGGDISLGCWTATGQVESCKPAGKGPRGSPCKKPQSSSLPSPRESAKQAAVPAGSGDMDLTNYFATLPNEMVPFRDLISPLPVAAMGPSGQDANQPSTDNQPEAEPLQHSEAPQCGRASPLSQSCSGASRQPTEQEIQHMDELDLTINFGSLLDPEDNWAVDNSDSFAAIDKAAHAGSAADARKPFQELFATGS